MSTLGTSSIVRCHHTKTSLPIRNLERLRAVKRHLRLLKQADLPQHSAHHMKQSSSDRARVWAAMVQAKEIHKDCSCNHPKFIGKASPNPSVLPSYIEKIAKMGESDLPNAFIIRINGRFIVDRPEPDRDEADGGTRSASPVHMGELKNAAVFKLVGGRIIGEWIMAVTGWGDEDELAESIIVPSCVEFT